MSSKLNRLGTAQGGSLTAHVSGPDPSGAFIVHSKDASAAYSLCLQAARKVLCTGTRDSSCPCTNCTHEVGSSPDAKELVPNEHGNLLASSFDGIHEFLTLPPASSGVRAKVLLLKGADRLTMTSASSLLKVLEDPTILSKSLVLMSTDALGSVSPPVLSRLTPIMVESCSSTSGSVTASSSDLRSSARWISPGDKDRQAGLLAARKALPSIMAGLRSSDAVRTWRHCRQAAASPDASACLVEVLHHSFLDMVATASYLPALSSTVTSSFKDQASCDASSWGLSSLVSLSSDLGVMLAGLLPAQDLSSLLYRWVDKACSLAAKKVFTKPLLSVTKALATGAPVEDDIVVLEDEGFRIDFGGISGN